jgi:hypothetical protein
MATTPSADPVTRRAHTTSRDRQHSGFGRPLDSMVANHRVSLAIGPGVTFFARTTRGLYFGSLRSSATKSNMPPPVVITVATVDFDHAARRLATHCTPSSMLAVTRRAGKSESPANWHSKAPQRGMSERPAALAQDVTAIRTRSSLDPMRSARLVGREPGAGW